MAVRVMRDDHLDVLDVVSAPRDPARIEATVPERGYE